MRIRRKSTLGIAFSLVLLLCVSAATSAPAEPAAPPPGPTIADMVALIEAGAGEALILRQVEATGTHPVIDVDAMIRLKNAGATDALIEALMDLTDRPAEEPASGFRIFTETTGTGEKVIHITNLDASGRRIGGEIPEHARRNVIAETTASPAVSEAAPPTVYVEVYRNEPEPPPEPIVTGGYGVIAPGYPGGIYPGYYPGWYGRGRRSGRLVGTTWSPYSPPGSYSHYRQYHHPAGVFPVVSPRTSVIVTAPYRAGSAAARNRAVFRRH